jgi:preprotein translocase subunit SecD
MADDVRERRADARERRRSLTTKPFEELNESADGNGSGLDSMKRAAATAAAAALAGALGGAAKAVVDRRAKRGHDDDGSEPHAQAEQDTHEEPESDSARDEGAVQADDMQDESDNQPAQDADAGNARESNEAGYEPNDQEETHGASQSDAGRVVAQARSHLQELLGEEAESVSGLERSNGRWTVTLEVVELRRIPESTDVMSSYAVVLDDDGGVLSINRKRRYRRSQIEEQ